MAESPTAVNAYAAPGGDVAYEGKVGWTGELGFGVKAPEAGQTAPAPAIDVPDHQEEQP